MVSWTSVIYDARPKQGHDRELKVEDKMVQKKRNLI